MDALPLPEADADTTAAIKDWLARFAACVREVDYAAARPFWHDSCPPLKCFPRETQNCT